jgi:hypothetical protein
MQQTIFVPSARSPFKILMRLTLENSRIKHTRLIWKEFDGGRNARHTPRERLLQQKKEQEGAF